jgi:hypothetical protein
MKKSAATKGESPSRLIDARIKDLDDWRGKTLSHVRALVKQAEREFQSDAGPRHRSRRPIVLVWHS